MGRYFNVNNSPVRFERDLNEFLANKKKFYEAHPMFEIDPETKVKRKIPWEKVESTYIKMHEAWQRDHLSRYTKKKRVRK